MAVRPCLMPTAGASKVDIAHFSANAASGGALVTFDNIGSGTAEADIEVASNGNPLWHFGSDPTDANVSSFGIYDYINNKVALYIDTADKVGIGTTTPANTLDANGTIHVATLAAASATTICRNGNVLSSCSSSIRYKEKVNDAPFGLKDVMKMRPVTFKWKGRDEKDLGFIAEEMEKVNPLFVSYERGQIEGVKYPQLTAVLANAIKEQQAQIESLKAANDKLEARLNALEAARH